MEESVRTLRGSALVAGARSENPHRTMSRARLALQFRDHSEALYEAGFDRGWEGAKGRGIAARKALRLPQCVPYRHGGFLLGPDSVTAVIPCARELSGDGSSVGESMGLSGLGGAADLLGASTTGAALTPTGVELGWGGGCRAGSVRTNSNDTSACSLSTRARWVACPSACSAQSIEPRSQTV